MTDLGIILTILGIIVAVIFGYLAVRYAKLQLKESKIQTEIAKSSFDRQVTNPENLIDTKKYSLKPTPRNIIDQLDNSPPYLKKETLNSYNDLKILWYLPFFDIDHYYNDIYRVFFRDYDSTYVIFCDIDIRDYPEFKILKMDHKVKMYGEIEKIESALKIGLKNCHFEFEFDEPDEEVDQVESV